MESVFEKYKILCDHNNVDRSHGVDHVRAVYEHIIRAIENNKKILDATIIMSLKLAAILHDADDHKYFPNSVYYDNAIQIMKTENISKKVINLAIKMIDNVSCSKNGNNIPRECLNKPWLLWVRWADQIEAGGKNGVIRCYEYNKHKKLPISCKTTPKPKNNKDILKYITKERFDCYKGNSNSMIDHYYDKLLYVFMNPPLHLIKCKYLEEKYLQLAGPFIDVCLIYSKYGNNGVIKYINDYCYQRKTNGLNKTRSGMPYSFCDRSR
tara:strand:- start:14208 stop:15008 length:801 start_codon:yes stop_codon:yes gene_type:complete